MLFQIRSAFTSVSQKLRAVKGVTLNVANKVYIKDGDYDLNEQLKTDAIKVFDAGLEKVNFGDAAAAANLINQWVSFSNYICLCNCCGTSEINMCLLFSVR